MDMDELPSNVPKMIPIRILVKFLTSYGMLCLIFALYCQSWPIILKTTYPVRMELTAMALTVFCIMGWAVIICLATVPGDMQRREGTFVFLMIMNINISFTWIVSEEMKRFILSGKVPEYLAFLISRSVLAPCLVLS